MISEDELLERVREKYGLGQTAPTAEEPTGDASLPAPGTYLTHEQFGQIIRQHGGTTGTFVVDPWVTQHGLDIYKKPTQVKVPNPVPRYRMQFADGTYLVMQTIRGPSAGGEQADVVAVNITDGGTAIKAPKAGDEPRWSYPPAGTFDPDSPMVPRMNPRTGVMEWATNENYDPDLAELKRRKAEADLAKALADAKTPAERAAALALINAQIEAQNRSGMGSPADWAKLVWEKERYPEETAYTRGEAERDREFKERQQTAQVSEWMRGYKNKRDELASNLGQWWSSQRLQAAPYVMNPAWGGTPPGWEAGGPINRLYDMIGGNYKPTVLSEMEFDPTKAWRLAQQATGG